MNPQFAGHTKLSLNRVLNDLIVCTQRKHNCKREEVTIKQIADFANDKFDHHKVKVDGKSVRQKLELVEYYKSLIETSKVSGDNCSVDDNFNNVKPVLKS